MNICKYIWLVSTFWVVYNAATCHTCLFIAKWMLSSKHNFEIPPLFLLYYTIFLLWIFINLNHGFNLRSIRKYDQRRASSRVNWYYRVYNFFTKNNLIYPLQFGFTQQYSTFDALISLTEDIRKNSDKGNIGCGIFVDLQKAFDTVEHILLAKLEHYGIHGITNEWF